MDFLSWLAFAGKFLGAVVLLILIGAAANLCLVGWMEMVKRCARLLRLSSGR